MENNAADSKLRSVKTSDVARLMELFQVKPSFSIMPVAAVDTESFQ